MLKMHKSFTLPFFGRVFGVRIPWSEYLRQPKERILQLRVQVADDTYVLP